MVSEELKIVIRAEASNAIRELRQAQGVAAKTATSFSSIAKSLIGPIGVTAGIVAVTRGLTNFIKQGVRFNAQLEQLSVGFSTLLGSTAEANKLLDELTKFASSTPLQLANLAAGTQQLLSFGVKAEDVVDTMRDLGNAAMGNQSKLDRLVGAYGKLQAKGRATLEELNMFTEAGVPILGALQEQLELTKEELFDYITKGKLGVEDVNAALQNMTRGEGIFAGMLEAQSKTFTGVMSTLKDNVDMLAGSFTEALLPALKDVADWLTTVAQNALSAKDFLEAMERVRVGTGMTKGPYAERMAQAEANLADAKVLIEATKAEQAFLRSDTLRARMLRSMGTSAEALDPLLNSYYRAQELAEREMSFLREKVKEEKAAAAELKRLADEASARVRKEIEDQKLIQSEYGRTDEGAIDAKKQLLAYMESISDGGEAATIAIRNIRAELAKLIAEFERIEAIEKRSSAKGRGESKDPRETKGTRGASATKLPRDPLAMMPEDFRVPALTADMVDFNTVLIKHTQLLESSDNSMDEYLTNITAVKNTMVEMVADGAMREMVGMFKDLGQAIASGGDASELLLKSLASITGMLAEVFLWGT